MTVEDSLVVTSPLRLRSILTVLREVLLPVEGLCGVLKAEKPSVPVTHRPSILSEVDDDLIYSSHSPTVSSWTRDREGGSPLFHWELGGLDGCYGIHTRVKKYRKIITDQRKP